MKFIKTTLIGGLLFLVPIVALVLVVNKALDVMLNVAEPVAEFLPIDSLAGVATVNVIAAAIVAITCFVAGLGAYTTPAKRLAASILAYATYIDDLGKLSDAIATIAGRHVACNVTAEQYPIVGECLLEAIKTVLGDAATDEIMEAWKKAYFILADVFIKEESDLYAAQKELA